MIVHDCLQGTSEWYKVRSGIPTASAFAQIITPKTLKLSKQSDEYENKCIAERMIGMVDEDFGGNAWTERGKEFEDEALRFYELEKEVDVELIGFVTNDEKTFGCSPDALVGKDGGLELKCPKAKTQIKYLVSETGAYEDYKTQVQGSLFVTKRKWWDIMSYHPDLPPSLYRVYPDLEFHETFKELLEQFEFNIKRKMDIIKKGNK